MEGLELGSEAYMPFDACRPVTTCLAAGDTETRLLYGPSIARLCMQLPTVNWLNRKALCLCFVFEPYLPEEAWIAFALLRRLSAVLFALKHDDVAEERRL